MDPHRTPYEVYLAKTGRLEPEARDDDPTSPAALGNHYESGIVALLSKIVGLDFDTRPHEFLADNGVMLSHPDGVQWITYGAKDDDPTKATTPFIDPFAIAEVKMKGWTDEWGKLGQPPPLSVQIQVYGAMACRRTIVNAYIGVQLAMPRHHEFRHYTVPYDKETVDKVEERACQWWELHVKRDVPPAIEAPPDLTVMKSVKRKAGQVFEATDGDVLAWLHERTMRLKFEKSEQEELATLLAKMGESMIARCPSGVFELSRESGGRRLDTGDFRKDHPELWEKYSEEITRLVPRWRPVKRKS